ncbi:MAG: hypothetical protein U0800_20245 [Isosphaeraceae bacterium]
MRRPRFSLRALMILVGFCAVAFAALRDGSDLSASILFTGALALGGSAILAAVYRKGRPRAFYAGAAAFGRGYLALTFGPGLKAAVRPRLVTTSLLEPLYSTTHPETIQLQLVSGITARWNPSSFSPNSQSAFIDIDSDGSQDLLVAQPSSGTFKIVRSGESFQDIGHALSAILAGLMGGWLAAALQSGRDRPSESKPQ